MYLNPNNYAFRTLLIFSCIVYIRISTVDAISEDVLDTQFPILISENHESLPSSKSLFGYTVSLAQGKIPFNDKVSVDVDGWIFIGAPKSNASKEYYADDAVEPGVLWRCSLGRRNGKDNCEIMNVDPKPSSGKRNASTAPAFENHSGAFIGGALELNHDHLLTCGWRWNRGRQKFYNGICYWFQDTNDTSRTSFRSPDLSKLVNTETYEQRLLPFFVKIPEKDRLFHFIDSDNKNVSAHEWQISLFGVNTHLFLDKGGLIPNLLVGAPGVREYSGAVVLYTNTKTPTDEEMARTNRNNDPTFSQFVVGNRGVIPDGQTRRTYWNEYFGYSVSSGRYLNKDQIHYVSGAPRAHHSGEVIIFDIPLPLAQQPRVKRQVQPVLEIKPPGNSFGSYFGAVLHSVDLDGDGQDELIVGAPLYTLQSSSSSKNSEKAAKFIMEEYGDHGSVFVYNFSKIEGKPNERYSFQHLNGSRTPRAQFGSAISSIKFDYINGSKETYLVVGAPYEKSDSTLESSGAIYLYKYNVALGKYGTLSQRIVASQLSSSLKGFGSSLSIPQDIDFNKTPDIAIGSYMSGQAVVLRTRPKVLIKSWIEFNSEKENITQVRRGVEVFTLKSCFSIKLTLGEIDPLLDFWVTVKFLDSAIRFSRNTVNDRAGNSHNEIVYLKKRSPTYGTDCQELEIESVNKDGIGMDDSDEFKERIHFTQEVRYNDTVNRPLTVLNYTATSGTATSNSDIKFTSFQSGQPTSQISKTSADLLIQPNDCRGPVCIPLLAISSWSFYNEKNETISSFLLGSSKEIRMQIVIENNGETAVKPRLILDWDNVGITESDSGSRWLAENCKSDSSYSNRMTYRCKLGQHLKNGRNKTIDIDLNMADIYAKQQENYAFDVNGAVRVEDAVIKPETGRGMLVLEVPPTLVWISGSRDPENVLINAMDYSTSVIESPKMTMYSSFSLDFSTGVLGASVGSLAAEFKVPIYDGANNEKKPLFLVLKPEMDPKDWAKCTTKLGFHQVKLASSQNYAPTDDSQQFQHASTRELLNPPLAAEETASNLKQNENNENGSIAIAIDRMLPMPPTKATVLKTSDDALTLSCTSEETSCMEIICTASNIKAKSHYHIQFILYPIKKAIDDIIKSSGKSRILVEGKGYAHIFSAKKHHQDDDAAQTILSIDDSKVELWIYIASGTGGLLLLLLIIVALYKCGFFKREKRQQLNHMKAEHHRKSMMVRASMMMIQSPSSTGTEDFGSQDMLAEAEHQNEDLEPEQTTTTETKDEK